MPKVKRFFDCAVPIVLEISFGTLMLTLMVSLGSSGSHVRVLGAPREAAIRPQTCELHRISPPYDAYRNPKRPLILPIIPPRFGSGGATSSSAPSSPECLDPVDPPRSLSPSQRAIALRCRTGSKPMIRICSSTERMIGSGSGIATDGIWGGSHEEAPVEGASQKAGFCSGLDRRAWPSTLLRPA